MDERLLFLWFMSLLSCLRTYLSRSALSWGPQLSSRPPKHMHCINLPFFLDLAALYAFLVSFPWLMILIATDQDVLTRSLNRVRSDGAITICDQDLAQLAAH